MRLRRCEALALAALTAASVGAQEQPPQPGERVRLKIPNTHEVRGRLVEVENDVLVIDAEARDPSFLETLFGTTPRTPGRVRVPLPAVTTLEVARGKKSNWPLAFGAGAVVGGGAVLLGGAASASYGPCAAAADPHCGDSQSLVIAGVAMAAVATLALGLLVKNDRWVSVTPRKARVTIAPLPGRGVAVAFSLRL
jgi:hypothetical protein